MIRITEEEKLRVANANLSNKLDKITGERNRLQREFMSVQDRLERLAKAHDRKMRIGKILVKKDGIDYVLQVTREVQTPDGLLIEGRF